MENKDYKTRTFTSTDGRTITYFDGKLHNWDGPALITPEGREEYYINGTQHSKDSHKKAKKDGVGLPWYKSSVAKARF